VQQKAGNPQEDPATYVLPDSTAAAGLYHAGNPVYPTTITADGTTSLWVECPRRIALRLPDAWAASLPAPASQHCRGRLDLNTLGPCPDGTSCPLGTAGHDPAGHYGPDINYYFLLTVPKPKGKGSILVEYDIVWTDVTYRVTRWAQGVANETACEWRITGNIAELWTGSPSDESRLSTNAPVALDVSVTSGSAACSP
jgi:hypothetical protein